MKPDPAHLLLRFGSLGEVVLSFAAGESLKRRHPTAPLVYVVGQPWVPLVRAQPWVDEVLPLASDRRAFAVAALRRKLASRRWAGGVDLQDDPWSRFLSGGLGARVARWRAERWTRRRLVWGRRWPRWARGGAVAPTWLRFLDAARSFGAECAEPPRVRWPGSAESVADDAWRRWEAGAERIVAVAPGAPWATARWPESRFLAVGRQVTGGGGRVLVLSSAAEKRGLPDLEAWADREPRALWSTGPPPVLAALLARCRALVTGDLGLMHLSAAVGTRVVALFGSSTPELGHGLAGPGHETLRLGLACQPCALHGRRRCPLGHLACLHGLSPARVLEALESILASPVRLEPAAAAASLEGATPL